MTPDSKGQNMQLTNILRFRNPALPRDRRVRVMVMGRAEVLGDSLFYVRGRRSESSGNIRAGTL